MLSAYQPTSLSAQSDSAWTRAQDLIAVGRIDSARGVLRRIAIESPNSSRADDALLQLATMAYESGQPALVIDYAGRLRLDYPGSDLRSRAALWAGRARLDSGEPRTGCAMLDTALVEASGNVELINQVAFYRSRCSALLAAAPPAPAPHFEVQVAAARSDSAATRLAARYQRPGRSVHLRRDGDGFTRVRVGPYATRELAETARRELIAEFGGSPFIVYVP